MTSTVVGQTSEHGRLAEFLVEVRQRHRPGGGCLQCAKFLTGSDPALDSDLPNSAHAFALAADFCGNYF